MAPAEKVEGTGMTNKQKLTALILLIVLIVVIWQIKGLFSGGGSNQVITPTQKSPVMSNNAPMSNNTPMSNVNAPGGAIPNPTSNPMPGTNPPSLPNMSLPVTSASVTPTQAPSNQMQISDVSMDNQILEIQKESEQKYVDQLNQLQMLKIQREIAETNQAIATARLATVTAEKNVSDILTKPLIKPVEVAPPSIPAGAYANALIGGAPPVTVAQKEVLPAPPLNNPPPPVVMEYVVISVSMEFGRWTAVLGAEGKLYNVSVGDVLPTDGSVVVSINRNGVTLIKNGKRRKVSIISSI